MSQIPNEGLKLIEKDIEIKKQQNDKEVSQVVNKPHSTGDVCCFCGQP